MMPSSADAVVAGAGIVGLSIALALARRGRKTVVLDRAALGGSTSAGTFAWLNATSKTDDLGYHRLNAGGMAAYETLAASVGADVIGLAGRGSLQWAGRSDAALHARLAADHRALVGFGYPVGWLDAAAMRAACPGLAVPDDAEGLLATADRWLEVPRYLAWAAAELKRMGGAIAEHAPLLGARHRAGRIAAVETSAGVIATDCLVVAAGIATGEALSLAGADGARLPMHWVPGFLLETPPVPLGRNLELLLWSPDHAGFHLRPTASGGLLLGADDVDEQVGDGGDAARVKAAIAELLSRAREWFPAFDAAGLAGQTRWRIGHRAIPADGHSIVGPVGDVPGLYFAVTHSGVTLAPRLAQLLADFIVDGMVPDAIAPFLPSRFGL
jgi:glycine/D-amino acid oxidase-like deaminating enzyme